MILITGSATIHPQFRDEAVRLGIEHSVRSRAEPGCIDHRCHIDAEDPNRIVFVEEWADMAAVQTHFAVPESGAFVQALTALAVAPPKMAVYAAEVLQQR